VDVKKDIQQDVRMNTLLEQILQAVSSKPNIDMNSPVISMETTQKSSMLDSIGG
jgi:hypothetical protein